MHPKDADGIANSVDPDQTARSSLIWVCTVCPDLSVRKLSIITVSLVLIFLIWQLIFILIGGKNFINHTKSLIYSAVINSTKLYFSALKSNISLLAVNFEIRTTFQTKQFWFYFAEMPASPLVPQHLTLVPHGQGLQYPQGHQLCSSYRRARGSRNQHRLRRRRKRRGVGVNGDFDDKDVMYYQEKIKCSDMTIQYILLLGSSGYAEILSHCTTKTNKMMCAQQRQIIWLICAVWSESLLCAH